jgi:L-seryl-tRNA(Ser) seleniumtransferase
LRVDKLTIAALEVTLRAYLRGAWNDIPAQRMIRLPLQEIAARTKKLCEALRPQAAASDAEIEIADGSSLVGGGSTPAQSLPTKLLRVASARHSSAQLEARLRQAHVGIPVIARIEDGRLVLDLRTVFPEQEPALLQSLLSALS